MTPMRPLVSILGLPAGPPRARFWIALLILLTLPRVQTLLFLPKLAMFGGDAPDAWLAAWVSDAILGLLIPLALFALHRWRGPVVWGSLLIYNAVGAFDYSHGLATQFTSPLPASIAPGPVVYGGIAVCMVMQLLALLLLFRREVIDFFLSKEPAYAV